jgi:ribosomal protein L25 (general stress protein Ctc)
MLRYKLRTTTVAVHQEATRSVAISIPAGTVLKVFDSSANSSGLVDVEWDGKRVQVFAVDLRDRGELFRVRGTSHDEE